MHRHGYKGRKLQRGRDQRRALVKNLATSLIVDEAIETTIPKAKEVVPYVEKLITKAKRGGLHNLRLVMRKLDTPESVEKLMSTVANSTQGRTSGHLRIEKTRNRRGDNAPLARISFVDNLEQKKVTKVAEVKKPAKKAVKTPAKKEDK